MSIRPSGENLWLRRRGPDLFRSSTRRPGSCSKTISMSAPLCCPSGPLRVHRGRDGALGESLHRVPRHSPHRSYQEKGGRVATERDEFARATWRVMVATAVEQERLVFVDECGTHTSLAPIYGYAPRGERLRLSVPRSRGKNTTLLSSMTISGMGPSLAVEGATTARVFETYVEKVLVPSLRSGQSVVMDNLGAHRPKRVSQCGTQCPAGVSCVGGQCEGGQEGCPAGYTDCREYWGEPDSYCVDLQTDFINCGACGNMCPQGASCVAGACEGEHV